VTADAAGPQAVEHVRALELDWGDIHDEIVPLARSGVPTQTLIEIACHTFLMKERGSGRDWGSFMLPRVKSAIAKARQDGLDAGLIQPNDVDLPLRPAREVATAYYHSPSLIKGILPAEGIGMVYGPSGSAKGFFVLDIATAIAAGEAWQDRRTRQGPVVIVNLEGGASFPLRLRAWTEFHQSELPERLYVVNEASFQITDPAHVDRLGQLVVSANASGGLVIIDTLARASPGIDENSSEGMGNVIAGVERLQRLTGGLILLVHHVGKDATKGPRGHSSMLAALDCAIEIERLGSQRLWRLAKAKDGEDGVGGSFTLKIVPLGVDSDGDPLSSCVLAHSNPVTTLFDALRLPKGRNQRLALNRINALLDLSTELGRGGSSPTTPCISLERAVVECGSDFMVAPKRRPERARAAIEALVAVGTLQHNDGWLWRPHDQRLHAPPSTRPVSPAPKGAVGKNGISGVPNPPKTGESGQTGNALQ
jgi:putative DNA primase/helicase